MKLDFSGLRILVIGDPMQDIYHFGYVERLSPEAPVPVFIETSTEDRPGGARNVEAQLIALGVQVMHAWTDDWYTEKHRYLVGSHQLFRRDQDRCVPNLIPNLTPFNAIVISDYAKGACTVQLCQEVISSGIPVIVDPKGTDWSKYKGAALICPNENEYRQRTDKTYFDYRLIKRGAAGISLMRNGKVINFPATAKHVFDVTGAGDTVTAVMAACIAAKIPREEACKLANLAAGYVVGEVGTAVCPIEKLKELCGSV